MIRTRATAVRCGLGQSHSSSLQLRWKRHHESDLRCPVSGFRRNPEGVVELEEEEVQYTPAYTRDQIPLVWSSGLTAFDGEIQPQEGRQALQVFDGEFAKVPLPINGSRRCDGAVTSR